MKEKIPVIYILGSSYSGSTILSLILGSDKKIFNCGELCKYSEVYYNNYKFDPNKELNNICTCGEKISNCTYWKNIYKEIKPENLELNPSPGFSKVNLLLLYNIFFKKSIYYKNYTIQYKRLLEKLISRAKEEKNSSKYILDDSKSLFNLYILSTIDEIDLKVLFIHRNSVNVINSFKKHNNGYFYGCFSWSIFNIVAIFILKKLKLEYILVDYKELCKNTSKSFKEINYFLKTNLKTDNYIDRVNNEKYHVLAGNSLLNSLKNNHYSFQGLILNNNLNQMTKIEILFAKLFTIPIKIFLKYGKK